MGQDELCELAKTERTCQAGGLLNRTGGIIVVAGMDFSGFAGPAVASIWVAAYPNVLACNRLVFRGLGSGDRFGRKQTYPTDTVGLFNNEVFRGDGS